MTSGGLIIRLIDVVLIILLGFLNISDFILKAQIKLDSGNTQETRADYKSRIFFVRVLPDASFDVEEYGTETRLLFSNEDGTSLVELEKLLIKAQTESEEKNTEMIVVISSDGETKIQYTIDVLDLCEKNKIPRSISY